jgi:DNA gyrase subunit B
VAKGATQRKVGEGESYSARDIEVLEGLEPVRQRPGMYIGSTDGVHGLHHLVKEILDNSVDEAMNGYASKIEVTLHEDSQSITISDNGRGIPVDIHPKFKKPALELILTTLHAGGKFSSSNYAAAGGLHGVGASVVNALSSEMVVTVSRDGAQFQQTFSRGKPQSPLKRIGMTKARGTKVFFRPDLEIFSSVTFSPVLLGKVIQEKAYLNKGLVVVFHIEGKNPSTTEYCYPDGIGSYLNALLKERQMIPLGDEVFLLEKGDGIGVSAAFCWTESPSEETISFANGIRTSFGGSHEDAFKSALARAIKNYLTVHDAVPKGVKVTSEDLREGLVSVLSVSIPSSIAQLQFQGQTKEKLNTIEVQQPVEALIKTFENTLNSKPSYAGLLTERVLSASRARLAARTASQGVSRKIGISHRLNLPGKLADCSSTNPKVSELLIVEGDSAGGSAKQGRDRKTQAVLPLRGKVLNVVAVNDEKIKENAELMDLVSALGCGYGKNLRLEKLRYSKVIILTDADADGMHIASLLIAFFCKCMRGLVDAGHLYLGLAPLYRIRYKESGKEKDLWASSEQERERLLSERTKGRGTVTRFKGLGEMNPSTLWETTLDPKVRNLLQMQIGDEGEAQAALQSLFGKDSNERYKLIQEFSSQFELDI